MTDEQLQRVCTSYPTPFYIFDTDILRERILYLNNILPKKAEICYAVKANTFISDRIKDIVSRFEVCSEGEFRICENQGIPMEKLVISGVYKTPAFIDELVRRKLPVAAYTVESMSQLGLLCESGRKYGALLPVLIRVTSGNQFGLNEEEALDIIKRRDSLPVDILGIQYFSGTQKTSVRRLKRELERLDGMLRKITETTGFVIRELEFGAGLPVSYFEGSEFDEKELLEAFSESLKGFGYDTRIIIELGRSIAASCGHYVTSIVDTKTNKGENYAITDGGMNHIVYFGQSMAMKKPFIDVIQQNSSGETENWNICGALCSVNDIMVKQLPMRRPSIGDRLIFKNTGAYCMTEGISLFLSRPLPMVIIAEKDKEQVIRGPFETCKLNQREEN